jgi:hypothetical protein
MAIRTEYDYIALENINLDGQRTTVDRTGC